MLGNTRRPVLALDVNIVQDNVPIEIAHKLFIGSIHAAFNQEVLLSLKITHVSLLTIIYKLISMSKCVHIHGYLFFLSYNNVELNY